MMQPEDIVFKVVVASYEHMSKIVTGLYGKDTPALSCGMHHNWRWSIMKECKILR
ncbi:hypothetical protein C5167_027241 [Papaver somniferum]|nr:hypothetical protein C5167_027241 [Papaver somniferum]